MKLLFELTNDQRKYLGLEPICNTWDLVQINDEVFLYFDKDIIRKKIRIAGKSYHESQLFETTANNRQMLLPKTPRGKTKKLNYTSISQRCGHGVYFYFSEDHITIANYTTQTTYYSTRGDGRKYNNYEDLKKWLNEWTVDTTEQDLLDLEQFKNAERKHAAYKEGDFFTFRIGRREYGFGRILLDINKLRKDKDFEQNKNYGLRFMGKPLIVKVYHIISKSMSININELLISESFPSQQIMDNVFLYGEYSIIGSRTLLPDELEFPISYGQSIHAENRTTVYLQYGLIYKEIDISMYNKYLKEEELGEKSKKPSIDNFNPFRNDGIGFCLDVLHNIEVMRKCIELGTNDPYWNLGNYFVLRDLRNPAFRSIRREIFNNFGLDADASYAVNLKRQEKTQYDDVKSCSI